MRVPFEGAGAAGASSVPVTEVGVLDKTAAVLQLLTSTSMRAAEISSAVGLSRSTGYRLLGAMTAHGFIVRTVTGYYTLGPFPRRDVLSEIQAVLTGLRDQTGESAQLWMRDDDRRVCVMSVDSKQDLRISKSAGTALMLADGGSGAHALLASGSPSELFITRGGRTAGSGSATIAFDVDRGLRLGLCVSFPLARIPGDAGATLAGPLSTAVQLLQSVIPESAAGDAFADIAATAHVET